MIAFARYALLSIALLWLSICDVQAQNRGFQLSRYTPAAPNELSFMVDAPRFSPDPRFTAGFSLRYGYRPLVLVLGVTDRDGRFHTVHPILEHQLLGPPTRATAKFASSPS